MASDAPQDDNRRRFVLSESGDDVRVAQESLFAEIEAHGYDQTSCFAIRLAVEEALANAFKHGNKNDPSKTVTFRYAVADDSIEIDVTDQGEGFDPAAVPDPTEEENLEIPSGRGIVLIRSFMSEVRFEPPGNRLRMLYRKGESAKG